MALLLAERRERLRAEMEILADLKCPRCGCDRSYRDGIRYLADGSQVQRFLCRNWKCGFRFSDPRTVLYRNLPCEAIADNGLSDGREYAELKDPKNSLSLVYCMTEQKSEQTSRESLQGTKKAEERVLAFLWFLKKQGRRELTIKTYSYALKKLASNADLFDPESIKAFLCKTVEWGDRTKQLHVHTYDLFLKWLGKTWIPPIYKPIRKMPFVPNENQLDRLIASCGKKLSVYLEFLKQTGCRCSEASMLEWSDTDFQRKCVNITPKKDSNGRILPINDRLIGMLQRLPKKDKRVWACTLTSLKTNFYLQRKKVFSKLNDPALMKISLHSFRHWKATVEYHRTKDIIHVQQLLGHRDIKSTMIYISLESSIFNDSNDEFHVRTARNSQEAEKLLEVGFEYICTTPEGTMLFRKRK